MMQRVFALAAVIASMGFSTASAVTLHEWNFNEAVGTGIEATANSGTQASGGVPTWSVPTDQDSGDWATNGAVHYGSPATIPTKAPCLSRSFRCPTSTLVLSATIGILAGRSPAPHPRVFPARPF